MLTTHLASLLITILYYLVLGISFYGWGRLAVEILSRTNRSLGSLQWPYLVWMGWAVWLLVLQTLHLAVPINAFCVIPLLAVGLTISAGCMMQARDTSAQILRLIRSRRAITGILLLLLAVLWIASRSMLPPENYDAGLYYMNSIRWINNYSIVPGLGNLHGRLAFNQSYFTYAAALNLYPYFGYGRSIANSFLLILTMVTSLHMLWPVLAKPSKALELSAGQWMPALFILPILAYYALKSKDLASPGPDLAVELLILLLFLIFCRIVDDVLRREKVPLVMAAMMAIVAATAITIKLSSLVPCFMLMGLVVTGTLWSRRHRTMEAVLLLLPPMVILIIWMFRGVISSGAPLFPSTFGYLDTSWSMPREAIVHEAKIIYGWARKPWTDYSEVIGNWEWFSEWFWRMLHFPTLVLYPTAIFAVLATFSVLLSRRGGQRARMPRQVFLILSIPLLAGLVFWFFTAPNPRFAQSLFVLLPISAVIPIGIHLQKRFHGRAVLLLFGLLFLTVNINYLVWAFNNRSRFWEISHRGWYPVPRAELQVQLTESGLPVITPVQGFQCWDAPLPCTPYFNKHVKLRREDELSSGFYIGKEENRQ